MIHITQITPSGQKGCYKPSPKGRPPIWSLFFSPKWRNLNMAAWLQSRDSSVIVAKFTSGSEQMSWSQEEMRAVLYSSVLHRQCAALCQLWLKYDQKNHWRLFRNVFKLAFQHLSILGSHSFQNNRKTLTDSPLKTPTKLRKTIGGTPSISFGLGQSRIQDNEWEGDVEVIYFTVAWPDFWGFTIIFKRFWFKEEKKQIILFQNNTKETMVVFKI